MTLSHFIGGKIVGNTADFDLPLSVNYPNLSTFINSETLEEYILVAGVWQKIGIPPFTGQAGWIEVGRTTLGAAASSVTVTDIPDKDYYMILVNDLGRAAASTNDNYRAGFGSIDVTANYAFRQNANGGGDGAPINQTTVISTLSTLNTKFAVHYITNVSSSEKLANAWEMQNLTDGSANPPNRNELVWKWGNVTNPLDQFQLTTTNAETYNGGTEIVVLGWDTDDVHTDNFWEELGIGVLVDPDTIRANIIPKKYLWIQIFTKPLSGTPLGQFQFNNDVTGNYTYRESTNGGTDTTNINQTSLLMYAPSGVTNQFINAFILNTQTTEKLVMGHTMSQNTLGAAAAPERREVIGKWTNTISQISQIDYINITGGADWAAGTFFKVWGHD